MALTVYPNGIQADVTGNVTGTVQHTVTVASADGAISVKAGVVMITKGTAAALTLAAPAAADDGKLLIIQAATAAAHTVTQTTPGFNNGSTGSDVATFGGAIGDNMVIVAYNQRWHIVSLRNVTVA